MAMAESPTKPPLDALVRWLQTKTEHGLSVVDELLNGKGYIVIPDVLSSEECTQELDRLWDFVTTVSPSIDKKNPKTWYPNYEENDQDPWPHTQKDRFQLYQSGWVFNDLREKLADRVFEPLVFGIKELHCSKDGFTFHRPTGPFPVPGEASKWVPEFCPPYFMKGPRHQGTFDDHFDQGGQLLGLQCIQGSVSLLDQGPNDGCFLCWPGSYRCHRAIMDERASNGKVGAATARYGGSDYYVPLTKKELTKLEAGGYGGGHKMALQRVEVKKGSVILWRSDLIHSGGAPKGPLQSKHIRSIDLQGTNNFRAVVYVCMAPAALTPERCYQEKREAYQNLHTSGHWPSHEDWFLGRDRPPREPYWIQPPPLTERQAQLYGLVHYPEKEEHDNGDDGPQEGLSSQQQQASWVTTLVDTLEAKNISRSTVFSDWTDLAQDRVGWFNLLKNSDTS